MSQRIVTVMVVALVALSGLGSPAHARPPIRSGAVLGGPITTGPDSECVNAPDCVAWLASGCSSKLAGLDPAVQSSIVDVRALAGRRSTRHLVVGTGLSRDASTGVRIGGFRIQLWTAECEEFRPSPPIFDLNRTYYPWFIRTEARFKIPRGVAWMTAVADDNVLIRWELY